MEEKKSSTKWPTTRVSKMPTNSLPTLFTVLILVKHNFLKTQESASMRRVCSLGLQYQTKIEFTEAKLEKEKKNST
ncbi:hypothetical protein CsSME_00018745 [Camellia sinensis var. sinensis]